MAAETERDPWETGSGMVDDVDGYMTECFFGVDEKYNADAVLFCATLVDANGEPLTQIKYSVGQDWETNNDGSEISHPSKTQINQNSRFGYFIDRLAKPTSEKAPKDSRLVSPKGKENGLGLGATLRPRGTPFQAKTFEGLGFHWDLHKGATLGKDEATGNPIYKDVLYPTKYIGEWKSGSASAAKTGAAAPSPKQTTPAASETPVSTGGGDSTDIPVALRKKLTLLALENDVKSFLKAAARDREVLALPDAATAHILDASAEGFHAQANG